MWSSRWICWCPLGRLNLSRAIAGLDHKYRTALKMVFGRLQRGDRRSADAAVDSKILAHQY